MATTVVQSPYVPSSAPGRRYDHLFFTGMVVEILVAVFVGFARSYTLPVFSRRPSPIAWFTSTAQSLPAGFFFSSHKLCWSRLAA